MRQDLLTHALDLLGLLLVGAAAGTEEDYIDAEFLQFIGLCRYLAHVESGLAPSPRVVSIPPISSGGRPALLATDWA